MIRKYVLPLALLITGINAMEVDPSAIRADRLHNVSVFYDREGFTVAEDGVSKKVHTYDVDKLFHNKSPEEIAALATIAKFKVSKFNNGEYAIRAHGDINGGGPTAALIAAFGVRVVGYSASLPWLFVPGGQPIFLAGCQITELSANYASAAALLSPTP